jgi:D-alanine--poly(phosphoribitol) ligase subunit 2
MEALIEILNGLHPEVDFETATGLIDNKVLDSFDIVTIISEVNDEYDVMIPADEIVPENFNSAQSLYALIERLIEE